MFKFTDVFRKVLLSATLLLAMGNVQAADEGQSKEALRNSEKEPRTAVKLSGALFAGVINPSIELRITDHITAQAEVLGCFQENGFLWTDKPLTIATAWLEGRYYLKKSFEGFFAGPNLGFSVYRMTKGIVPGYTNTYKNHYQVGNNMMVGATIGYQYAFNRHWGIEVSWGAGWQHSWYEGYVNEPETEGGVRRYIGYNKSAEWLYLYKAAINVVYRW